MRLTFPAVKPYHAWTHVFYIFMLSVMASYLIVAVRQNQKNYEAAEQWKQAAERQFINNINLRLQKP